MATSTHNLAEKSGNLLESHKNYDPRIVFFYFVLAALLLTLVGGLAYQQLGKVGEYAKEERKQTQRRILFPGPRGNVGFSYLDETTARRHLVHYRMR